MAPMSPVCSQPSRINRARRGFGIVEIALHHLRTADPHFAGFAGGRDRRPSPIDDAAFGVRHEHARLASARSVRLEPVYARPGWSPSCRSPGGRPQPTAASTPVSPPAQRRRAREQTTADAESRSCRRAGCLASATATGGTTAPVHGPVLQHLQERLQFEARHRDDGQPAHEPEVQDHCHAVDVEERQERPRARAVRCSMA